MSTPYLSIDLAKIEHNARTIVALCRRHGIEVAGVTKAVSGDPDIARAMLRGGVVAIADSRMANIHRLRAAGVEADIMLLRVPPLSAVYDTVLSTTVSLNSELSVLEALSVTATRLGKVHEVILMVDLGDLREGVWPDQLMPLVEQALGLSGIRITGIGTNLACFAGVVPSVDNMSRLVELAEALEQTFGIALHQLSGVNSSGLELIAAGRMPTRVNHARIGEAILLGRETVARKPWPDTHQDAFVLHAEVVELKQKPSLPIGDRGEDAFGGRPLFEDRGKQWRALVNLGREDVDIAGIRTLDDGLSILGGSSGYLVIDVGNVARHIKVGDELGFSLNYSALLTAMACEHVEKRVIAKGPPR